MLFMAIERFKDRDPIPVYQRVRDPGIQFPERLKYIGSWIEPNFDRCFQLLECDDLRFAAGVGALEQSRYRHDLRDRPGRAEQGNTRGRRPLLDRK
jgi:Protein of unknown function (DUF3303)